MSTKDNSTNDDLITALFGKNVRVCWSPIYEAPKYEKEIVWLLNPRAFRFVRCRVFYSRFRERKPSIKEGLLIGYSTLTEEAGRETCGYARRLFYIRWEDMAPTSPYQTKPGACPAEAVKPLSVKPGIWGKQ